MARNGSGVYNLPTNSWNPATNGVSATAVDWQNLINDVASALTQSLSADGQTPVIGNLAMSNNKLTGLAAGTGAGQSIRWEQVFTAPASFGGGAINVDASGNVGIGAAADSGVRLHVRGSTNRIQGDVCALGFASAAAVNNWYVGANVSDTENFGFVIGQGLTISGGTQRFAIDSNGNVSIGTSSPGEKLNVSGAGTVTSFVGTTDTSGTAVGRFTASYQGGGGGAASSVDLRAGNGYGYLLTTNDNPLLFGTNSIERMRIEANGQQSSVIPGGTVLYPEFKCRAWVNFNGTGTVAIRASGNVSSITDNGTGSYNVNFTTAMPDANYVVIGMGMVNRRVQYQSATFGSGVQSTSAVSILNTDSGTTAQDDQCINIAVFR